MAKGPWTPGPRWPQAVRRPVVGGRGVRAGGRATALGLCTPGPRCPQAVGCPGRCGRGVPAGSHATAQGPWTPGTRWPQAGPGRCGRGVRARGRATVRGVWTPGTRCPQAVGGWTRCPRAESSDRPGGVDTGYPAGGGCCRRPECGDAGPRAAPQWVRGVHVGGCVVLGRGTRCPRRPGSVRSRAGVRGVHVVQGVWGPGAGYAVSTSSGECAVQGGGTRCPRRLGSVPSRAGVRGVHTRRGGGGRGVVGGRGRGRTGRRGAV